VIKVDTERTLVYGCLHSPFQDVKAEGALLDFIKYWKPNRIIQNGDIDDLWSASRWYKNPARKDRLEDEAEAGCEHNSKVRQVSGRNCEIIRNWGNHEFRFDRYLQENAEWVREQLPKLYQDMRFEKLFGLEASGIIPNRGRQGNYARYRLGKIMVGHFEIIRKNSADTEQTLVNDSGMSIICSHSHRKGVFYKTLMDGTTLSGHGTGCLSDIEKVDYTENPNWQTGFVIVENMPRGRYHITDMPIVGGEILYNGRLF
jgi:hypothetical protein